jgi:hypothetical protein
MAALSLPADSSRLANELLSQAGSSTSFSLRGRPGSRRLSCSRSNRTHSCGHPKQTRPRANSHSPIKANLKSMSGWSNIHGHRSISIRRIRRRTIFTRTFATPLLTRSLRTMASPQLNKWRRSFAACSNVAFATFSGIVRSGRSPAWENSSDDHLGPLREYIHSSCIRVKVFEGSTEVWERQAGS